MAHASILDALFVQYASKAAPGTRAMIGGTSDRSAIDVSVTRSAVFAKRGVRDTSTLRDGWNEGLVTGAGRCAKIVRDGGAKGRHKEEETFHCVSRGWIVTRSSRRSCNVMARERYNV